MDESDFFSRFNREAARRGISPIDYAIGILNTHAEESNGAYRETLESSRQLAQKLEINCRHELGSATETEVEESIWATCEICRKSFGWRCPSSPDKVCHYFCDSGASGSVVRLIDKKLVALPSNYDSEHESSDWCIFCGNPEERK